MAKAKRFSVVCWAIILGIATAATCTKSISAFAQVSPLMGVWDGIATTAYGQVPVRYVITAGSAITRQALWPNGVMRHTGRYEIVGNQLHIIWNEALPESCIFHFESRDVFDCGGIRFSRVQ